MTDTNAVREAQGSVIHRGLCGDVYLVGAPSGARIADVKVDTSVRKGKIGVEAALQDLNNDTRYVLSARLMDNGRIVKEFRSDPFKSSNLRDGRITIDEKWKPEKLWDIHTPQNIFTLELSLRDDSGNLWDAAHGVRFGFRELLSNTSIRAALSIIILPATWARW
jgi:beta-galactosidase